MKNKDYSEVLGKIKIALYILVILFAVNLGYNIITTTSNSGNNASIKDDEEEEVNPLLESGQVLNEDEMVESIPEITYAEYKEAKNGDKVTVVMIGYDDCYWCQQQKEIIRDFLYDTEVNLKYLNIKKMTNEELEELESSHESLEGFGTPTFVAVKKDVMIVDTSGGRGTTALKTMFESMGAL